MKAWKNLEKVTAAELDGKRAGVTGISNADVLHDKFSIECKYRAKLAFKAWYEQAVKYAKGTNKIPLLICKEKGQHGEMVIIKMDDFKKILNNA